MFKKIICLIFILKLTQARYGFVPKFYGQDIAVIVDTDKFLPQNKNASIIYPRTIRLPPPIALWRHYPRYHIVPPPLPGQIVAMNNWPKALNAVSNTKSAITLSTTTTTTSTTPKPTLLSNDPFTDDEFPAELLDIAQNKLGLKNPDEIPSILELSQLLGTNSREETLKYIKQLASNDQGVALMKAYIESTDYTDNTGSAGNKNYDLEYDEDNETDDTKEQTISKDEGLMVVSDEDLSDDYKDVTHGNNLNTQTKPKPNDVPKNNTNMKEHIVNYKNINKLSDRNGDDDNKDYDEINRISQNGKKFSEKPKGPNKNNQATGISRDLEVKQNKLKTPILVRESIPFNYPVPLRAQTMKVMTTKNTANEKIPTVHLNTPKNLIPQVQEISRVTKIPQKTIEDFLATKPKLLELVNKVSRFPISYEQNSAIKKQVIAAVQKVLEQDPDLQKLLRSAATLN